MRDLSDAGAVFDTEEVSINSEHEDDVLSVGGSVDESNFGANEDGNASESNEEEDNASAGILPEKIPWNSPAGWKKVNKAIDKFMHAMKCPGSVCGICGERRHCGGECHINEIRSWCVHSMDASKIISEELYPPFPLKEFPAAVCLQCTYLYCYSNDYVEDEVLGVQQVLQRRWRKSRHCNRCSKA